MYNVILFSQNVKLNSLIPISKRIGKNEIVIFLTTHELYENERFFLQRIFWNCEFQKFADFLTDEENEFCDKEAYRLQPENLYEYYCNIKKLKNEIIANKIKEKYSDYIGYICSNDLGIDANVWKRKVYGFKKWRCEYYYNSSFYIEFLNKIKPYIPFYKAIAHGINAIINKFRNEEMTHDVYVSFSETPKYVFIGKMDRVSYRMNLEWKHSEEERQNIMAGRFMDKQEGQYLTTLHESNKCNIPDEVDYDVRYIQDGYLPPNYSSVYLKFKPSNVAYYAWDVLGTEYFLNSDIPVTVMPFRKKLYMPNPIFKDVIKQVLIATSGPGDWTAQKNRSDEDLMLEAFVEVAKLFPNIKFIYRCHPTWVHPEHNGVNSITRAADYITYSKCDNLKLSSNIPSERLNDFVLSFPRSSLEEDLKNTDMVFGEHSISMIDAAFKNIPFASVNLTRRRNLFEGYTRMGFPHCTSANEIIKVIKDYSKAEFKANFVKAVERYNQMTDQG